MSMFKEDTIQYMLAEKQAVPAYIVCQGSRYNSHTKKTHVAWQEIDPNTQELLHRPLAYDALIPAPRPGAIYEVFVTRDETGCVSTAWPRPKRGTASNAPVYIGTYRNESLMVTWKTLHEAADTAATTDKREKMAGKEVEFKKILGPIRVAMDQTDRRGRRAILVQVLEYLES